MPIQVGETLPPATFCVMTPDGPAERSVAEIFGGRRIVLFAVPGAFTPTCDRDHLPGYLGALDALKAHGVDEVAVTGVNDVFVFDAWAKATGAAGRIVFLADGNADFARALGLDTDASARGMGPRSRRYAMLVEDGVVAVLAVEETGGRADLSGAPAMLRTLAARGERPVPDTP